jgi:hypothetical protein
VIESVSRRAAGATRGTPINMNAFFHIVGCVVSSQPAAGAIDEFVDWARRQGAEVVAQNEREAVFVKFDAIDANLIVFACRAAAAKKPAVLRFGFASGVKEKDADGRPRLGERGIVQACDLAGAAPAGQVLVASQLGSLLQVANVEPGDRLGSTQVRLLDGRKATAYLVEPPTRATAGGSARE